ncbi:PRTRC system protein B [Paraburkholderia agricolaris]|uniref:PRTRC system protein B n=1 Tax=Paraburkholderia agricolaris TaxID=2152888 RepID=A0ABW8ZV77_9BURK
MIGTNFSTGGDAEVQIVSAILLYGQQNKGLAYGTVHPVSLERGKQRPTIGAGRPIDRASLHTALQELATNTAGKASFLPETVLAVSPEAITWWHPPARKRVFFRCPEIRSAGAVVPHPGLVFHASLGGFRVFATMEDTRPTPETVLYEPPYFNTWDWGKICIGTAQVPNRIDVAAIDGWECGFFESAFTHPNTGKRRIDYEDGPYAFWRDLLAGRFKGQFPKQFLISMNLTLASLIGGNIGEPE